MLYLKADSGPRHGKNVSPGLTHSVQKLIAEKRICTGSHHNNEKQAEHKTKRK